MRNTASPRLLQKNGECAYNDRHSEGYRWEHISADVPPAPENAENTVPPFNPYTAQAESYNSRDAASTVFWANQQNPFDAYPKELCDGVSTEEAAEFVQMNAFKYLQNFFYQKSGKKTFNWAAFIFAPYWFFYRKMYKLGAIFLALLLVISVGFSVPPSAQRLAEDANEWYEKYVTSGSLTEEQTTAAIAEQREIFLGNSTGLALTVARLALTLAVQLFIGFKANKWYYEHTVSKIRKIKAEPAEPELRKLNIYKEGGMSMGKAFLAVLANNIIVMAVNMLYAALNL